MLSNLFIGIGIILGTGLFLVSTVGLLRLPDVYTRLHALTKANNLGLGLIILSLAGYSGDLLVTLKLLVIWGLVLCANALSCHLIARFTAQQDITLWQRDLE
ncbi:MAG: hypothetical protein BWK79_03420 [Beggiatoa sp. IS2]|nr:MAG: hypothetical protein BWK79_03420 [Beggiatoa sp. IS2]